VEHLDPELLARYALGDDAAADATDQGHLADCDQCRAEVDELRRLADLGHELKGEDRLEPAPPAVWDRVVAELQLPAGAAAARPSALPGLTGLPSAVSPQQPPTELVRDSSANSGGDPRPGRTPRRGRSRFVLVGAVAATVGLIVGVLGTRILDDDSGPGQQPPPLASTRLEPLKGRAGAGTAELVRVGNDTELRVGVNGLTASPGFYELWLINADGKRMISLGILDPRTGGTFLVPADLTAQGYRIVDISLEPYDGKPEHSRDSVVRGTLPA
jgi:hypothetical protein